MAKRKRLTPAQATFLTGGPAAPSPAPSGGAEARAPIAQVAGDTSAHAALEELSATVEAARSKGLMIEELPLSVIEDHYLVRDRVAQDPEEMAALMQSLRARGQQTPIEVTALSDGRYGLISGWRRLTALRQLQAETGEARFATIKARLVQPESAQSAYLAMVEENEIRVNLSHYERARIVVKALHAGVYETQKQALQGLFGNVPRAKRSKIGSFIGLVEGLDEVLRFPSHISEKLGLALVKAQGEDAQLFARLTRTLSRGPAPDASAELAILSAALTAAASQSSSDAPTPPPAKPVVRKLRNGLVLTHRPDKGQLTLSGDAVDADMLAALEDWLVTQ